MSPSRLADQLHPAEPRWFAVRTRARCEKYVLRLLTKKRIHAYVPLQQFVRRYERKTRTVEKPLITSYVFVKIVKDEYLPVLETENVAGFVKIARELTAIPEEQIDLLRRITLEHDLEVEAVPGILRAGDPVEITAGHLFGLRGRLVAIQGKRKMQIELEQLGYSLLITVDSALLQKLNGPFHV